jgi:hypothetical protein
MEEDALSLVLFQAIFLLKKHFALAGVPKKHHAFVVCRQSNRACFYHRRGRGRQAHHTNDLPALRASTNRVNIIRLLVKKNTGSHSTYESL